jgi:hypothetical protein
MRHAFVCCVAVLTLLVAAPSYGGSKSTFSGKQTFSNTGNASGGLAHRPGGVMGLNASDCRLDGGEVVTPGDARCGKMGAPYCRKKNGEAACLTEQ